MSIRYVMDTPRNQASATFMSNMMYACSILYKTRLPMVVRHPLLLVLLPLGLCASYTAAVTPPSRAFAPDRTDETICCAAAVTCHMR